MDLPELPRTLDKKEARITPTVMDWFHKNYPRDWFLEIKATNTGSISFKAVQDHQLKALFAVRSKEGFKHKLSDAGRTRQPFDCFGVKKADSFVVACFLKHGICLAFEPKDWKGSKPTSPCSFSFKI